MTADTAPLLALARECGALLDFAPSIEFLNPVALRAFAERIRQDERERAIAEADRLGWGLRDDSPLSDGFREVFARLDRIRSSGTSEGDANDSQ